MKFDPISQEDEIHPEHILDHLHEFSILYDIHHIHMYTLYLSIIHPTITIRLKKDKKHLDQVVWHDDNRMSTVLLDQIDCLLQKHKLRITDIAEVRVRTDRSSYTSSRIAQAVGNTCSYCLTRSVERV